MVTGLVVLTSNYQAEDSSENLSTAAAKIGSWYALLTVVLFKEMVIVVPSPATVTWPAIAVPPQVKEVGVFKAVEAKTKVHPTLTGAPVPEGGVDPPNFIPETL